MLCWELIVLLVHLRQVHPLKAASFISDFLKTKNCLAWRSSPSEAIFICCMISQLRRYSDGDIPVCSLKYLPRNDWLEKFSSCAISLMLFCVLRSSIRSSMVT